MPLPVPKLDDRSYSQMMADALDVVSNTCKEWTDRNPADPGITLLEAFAFLTENMLYRLNRVPSKQFVMLLNLVGVQTRPPSAAAVELVFSHTGEAAADISIPLGAQVATGDGAVVFTVTKAATLAKDAQSVSVPALHVEQVDGELAGIGTGAAAQSFRVKRPPIIAPAGDGLDIVVGVEATPEELSDGTPSRGIGAKAYALWQPLESFADATPDMRAFTVNRADGLIVFSPGGEGSTLGKVPPQGREIRAWYRRGGGHAGNVPAGTLTAMKSPQLKVAVTNPERASGGSDAETTADTVRRGPLELTSMRCAVTARDFERIALTAGGIARARAYAQAQVWRHADPGVVEVLLVPQVNVASLPEEAVTAPVITDHRRDELLDRAGKLVAERSPLGVRTAMGWTKVRPVSATARVVVTRGEDTAVMASRLRKALNRLFSPFRDQPFGRELRASDVYEVLLSEPGVRYADQLRFTIGEAPNKDVNDLIRDPHQPRCWFTATAHALYRTLDDGESWSIVFVADGDAPQFVRRHPQKPGLMALGVTRAAGAAIHLSQDCGETWTNTAAMFNCAISDAVWITRNGNPVLLIATEQGLYQFQPGAGIGPAPVVIDKVGDAHGYYAVAAATLASGMMVVAISARQKGGVYFSKAGGVSDSFHKIGLDGKDIRTLRTHRTNARDYLWAAARAEAGDPGEGAFRIELRAGGEDDPDGFKAFNSGWQGGSCQDLTLIEGLVFAGSYRGGALVLDTTAANPQWSAKTSGLPIRDSDPQLQVCEAVAVAPGAGGPMVMVGGPAGVYRSLDGGGHFAVSASTEYADRIPLPPNWLYSADKHDLTVVTEEGG
jgi:hypothetical protein